jgi:phage baseplate assembly protein W
MTRSAWRGVRFLIPGFDVPVTDAVGGFTLDYRGALATIADRAAVRQALLLLFSTRPGERVMRPTYGCDLFKLIFWPNDDTTAGLAMHYVREAVTRWEPRVDRLKVDASRHPDDPSRLNIDLDYRVRSTGEQDRLSVQLDLQGSGA